MVRTEKMICGLQHGLGPVHGSIEIGFWFSTSAHLVSLLQDLLLKTSSAAGAKLMAFFWGMGPFHARVDGEMLPFFRSRGRSKGGAGIFTRGIQSIQEIPDEQIFQQGKVDFENWVCPKVRTKRRTCTTDPNIWCLSACVIKFVHLSMGLSPKGNTSKGLE